MSSHPQGPFFALVELFKTLGDETRLRIVVLLRDRELSVGEIAAELELSEPTISHHLARLREAMMLSLRADGTNRYYRFNDDGWNRWRKLIVDLETLDFSIPTKPDTNWIDELVGFEGWEKKVLKDYWGGERFRQLPAKEKKFAVIVRYVATKFEAGREYSEMDVNAVLKQCHEDYAILRRELVERGYLKRAGGGGSYWVNTG